MPRLGLGLLVLAVTLAITATAGQAVRLPTRTEANAVRVAIRSYVECCTAITQPDRVKATVLRVSTVDRRYGRADLDAPGIGRELVILRRNLAGWKVVRSGTSDVGCGSPLRVRRPLA